MCDKLPSAVVSVEPVFGFGIPSRLYGFAKALVSSVKHNFPIIAKVCFPSVSAFPPSNAENTGLVVLPDADIAAVLGFCNVSKIFNSVVGLVAVDVVNGMLRPTAVVHRPSNSVRTSSEATNYRAFIPLPILGGEGFAAFKSGVKHGAFLLDSPNASREHIRAGRLPPKLSGVLVIFNKLAYKFRRRALHSLVSPMWLTPRYITL